MRSAFLPYKLVSVCFHYYIKIVSVSNTIGMRKFVKVSLISLAVSVSVIAVVIGVFFFMISPNVNLLGAPELNTEQLTSYSRTIGILDARGEPIDDALYAKNKIYVRFDDLDTHTVDAFIAIEDKRFYSHKGIDYKRLASALVSNIKAREFREGASTITQQLIKNTHLSSEKTIKRKLNEMRLARKLETIYDKEQILESYFNILYFGSGIHGLGTASKIMFGKSAQELTIAESAALAAIINNPSKYSPYKNIENLTARKNLVLKEMLKQKKISKSEYDSAVDEALTFNNFRQTQFVAGVIKDACERFDCSEKQLFARNCTLKTSYDPNIVDTARSILNSSEREYAARILVLNNETGAVVCDETNRNNYINDKRSPASTIKPFISYIPALEKGYNPLSQINDEKRSFGDYAPHNYKDVYRGYQSLKDCLIYSSNVAAVTLLDDVGIDYGKSVASSFGLSFAESDDTLAVALGGMTDGVTLIDLANAYRTLANGGIYSETHYMSNASLDSGIEYFHSHEAPRRAVPDDTAYLITDMLSECAERGTAKKLKNLDNIAAKTGTNGDKNGNRDCYCIAYTPLYTIAVWYGAENDTPINNKITGASCCADIVELAAHCDLGLNTEFNMPQSVAYYDIDDYELRTTHNVYLADPLLPKRYRRRALFAKRNLPIGKNIDIIDFFDREFWNGQFDFGDILN